MYFVRFFMNGPKYDARTKEWAEMKCDVCGNEHHIDVTRSKSKFEVEKEIKCPHCGMVDFEDRESQIKSKIARLTEEKSKIDVEIEQLFKEFETKTVDVEANREILRTMS